MPDTRSTFRSIERARQHAIAHDGPSVDFFTGALLGNGGMGAVVTTRPDAVVIHFGHNNVWDIRVATDHVDKIGTFQEIFERVQAIPAEYERLDQDPWLREYVALMRENYAKPYPRPFPCGSLILGFDRRRVELLGHELDITNGRCVVRLLHDNVPVLTEIFVAMDADQLWLRSVDATGAPIANPFERIKLLPDPDGLLDDVADNAQTMFTALADLEETTIGSVTSDGGIQALGPYLSAPASMPERCLMFRQQLPFQTPEIERASPGHPRDRAFRLAVRASTDLEQQTRHNWHGQNEQMGALERALASGMSLVLCVQLDEGLASEIDVARDDLPLPDVAAWDAAAATSGVAWETYWSRSGVALEDQELERVWYRNLYFFNCAVAPGVTCPGLWANWSYRTVGSAWHGDYHMNYNCQQPFWVAFSSNHVEKHLPYVDLVERLMPVSEAWARDYYGMRGAFFPHSAYPAEMITSPYPVPTWGWEVCETPWTVQSLWWHYRYTLDRDFLEQRAFEPIKSAVLFLVDYMRRSDAHGPQWNDDRYHIFPTVPPELYGLMPGFRNNYDCLVDLTLTRFVFNAFLQACAILERETEQADLIAAVHDVLEHFPTYPTTDSRNGTVFVSVPGEDPETVYNVPNPVATVFPGEDHGLHSPPDVYAIAANSYRNMRNEGGNELVFGNLQGARLGLLDLERFKRQIRYCTLPNGTSTDMVLQVHGRYSDTLAYDFMADMGIWFENFALPVVINECLLQSYTGTLRLFPNWPHDKHAEFRTLRAAGAFLVSAAYEHGAVQWVEIMSEAGAPLRLFSPWSEGARCVSTAGEQIMRGEIVEIATKPGDIIRLSKAGYPSTTTTHPSRTKDHS